jgi:hypothetical protein
MPGTCESCGAEDRPVFAWARVDPFGRESGRCQMCTRCIEIEEGTDGPAEQYVDGESFRGSEAADYSRTEMARAKALK